MNIIKQWYMDGIYLLDDVYGDIMLLISIGITSILTIWRFFPLDLRLWAVVWGIVLVYMILSGMLMDLYITILSEPVVKVIAIVLGLVVIGTEYSTLQVLQGATMSIVTIVLIIMYKVMFNCYYDGQISDETIIFIEFIRRVYAWTIYALPFIASIVFSMSLEVTIFMLAYVICVPIICNIADIFGLFDGV